MAEAEVVPPAARVVIADEDQVQLVAAWAARQRATLRDLQAELAAIRPASAEPREGAGPRPGPDPTALLPLVDDLLRSASERLAARTAEVVAAADELVAEAVEVAAGHLAAGGLPADAVRPRDPLAGVSLSHRPTRTAAELWRTVSGSVARPVPWDPRPHPDARGDEP